MYRYKLFILLPMIQDYIKNNILLSDGAFGTYYSELNTDSTARAELANINDQKSVIQIHKSYISSGSKLIRTNTFSANTRSLGISRDVLKDIIVNSCKLAKIAQENREIYIAGNIGPIPDISEDGLQFDKTDILDEYKFIVDCFINSGISIFNFETFSSMDEISTQREYEALEREIKVSTEAEQEHRREIQKVDKTIEVLSEMLTSEEELLNQQKDEISEEKERIVAIIEEKEKTKNSMVSDEKVISQDMDTEILFKFERIIKNKSGLGIVPVVSGVCSGCHMTLPAQFANDVRKGEDILFCPYCSRILFHEDGNEDVVLSEDKEEKEDEVSLSDLIDDEFLLD